MFKRFVCALLTICLMLGIVCYDTKAFDNFTTYAATTYIEHGGCYTIQHVGSGKYLDINGQSTENGAVLQIWKRIPGNENQNFVFYNLGQYWKITPCHSNKAIEVRNSSYSDCAPVAQWEYADIACQQWAVVYNTDGTVSFRNRNSGKYLDVYGNGTKDGTPLIQYRRNNTTAQRFRITRVKTAKSIRSVSWTRSFSNSEIKWTQYSINSNTYNYTRFNNNGAFKYPTSGYTYLYKYEYIDADTVHNMLVKKGLNSSNLSQIKGIASGETKEIFADALLNRMGFGDFKGTGIAIGIVETLATSESRADWNRFANTTRSGKGILKKTYIRITPTYSRGPLSDGTGRWGWRCFLTETKIYTYEVWDGNVAIIPSTYHGVTIVSYNYN